MLLALGFRFISEGSDNLLLIDQRRVAWTSFMRRLIFVNTAKCVYVNFAVGAKVTVAYPAKHTACFGLPSDNDTADKIAIDGEHRFWTS